MTRLEGDYDGPTDLGEPLPAEPVIVFAGRHIPEKRVTALVPAFLEARKAIPELRMEIFGDGPDRPEVLRQVAEHGLEDVVDVPGFVPEERIDAALRRALCLVLPSRREGYGLVVIEAAARGVPVGRRSVGRTTRHSSLSMPRTGSSRTRAIPRRWPLRSSRSEIAENDLRVSARRWFVDHREALGIGSSIDRVFRAYAKGRCSETPLAVR